MRALVQILLWWTALSVVASVIVARAFALGEPELVPVRTRRQTRTAETHTAV